MANAIFKEFSKDRRRVVDPESDVYGEVPKDFDKNLEFREWIINECEADPDFALDVKELCRRDILFFINAFCWMKESREGLGVQYEEKIFPWITWPVQDWVLTEMQESLGVENFVFTKPRAAAASWCLVVLFFHQTIFMHDRDFGLASAKEEKVDNSDDPSSLFGKVDVLLRYMPDFLLSKDDYTRGNRRFVNHKTHSTMIGYASTGDLNTGGRNTAFAMDEMGDFPAGRDYEALETMYAGVTNSIFLISTYNQRRGCAFNKTAKDPKFPAKRVRISWRDCPPQAAGLYLRQPGQSVQILDDSYSFPESYEFVDDGKIRSPYFDLKSRGLTKQQVARQLEADEEGSALHGLDQAKIKALAEQQAKPPIRRCTIGFDDEDYELTLHDDPNGPLLIWEEPKSDDAYGMGIDLSAGTGNSNSVIDIGSRMDGRQVAAYVTAHDDPKKVCRISKALGFFYGGVEGQALMAFDVIGTTGAQFRDEIKRIGYWNHYKRHVKDQMRDIRTPKIGYAVPKDGWGEPLTDLIDACARGEATIHDKDCFTEFGEYVWQDGKIVHGGAAGSNDDSEALNTHGDRACAAAMRWVCCCYRRHKPVVIVKESIPKRGTAEFTKWAQDKALEEYYDQLERDKPEDAFNFA